MKSSPRRRLFRWPVSDTTRRALAEVAADVSHERRSAPTRLQRSLAVVAGFAAATRVVASTIDIVGIGHPMRNLGRDFHFAGRRLIATPMFTIFAIVTLALGIGVTTGIYSAVRAVTGPPAGLSNTGRLVALAFESRSSALKLSWPEFQELRAQQTVFDRLTGWAPLEQTYSVDGRAETAFGEIVSGDYFQTLGIEPFLGRTLQPADDHSGAPPVVVLGYRTWHRLFDGSPDAIGRVMKINGIAFQIVGVAPEPFHGLFNGGLIRSATWVPMSTLHQLPLAGLGLSLDPANRDRRWIRTMARLAPGQSVGSASAQLAELGARQWDAFPPSWLTGPDAEATRASWRWRVQSLDSMTKLWGADDIVGPLSFALMTAVGLVLLVACTNLANLMLARNSGRRQESAVRVALGASRWRLLRGTLAESVILSAIGAFAAIGVARLLIVFLGAELTVEGNVAVQLQPRLDLAALAAALGATFLALIIAGVVPAAYASRVNIRTILATDSLGASSARWRARRYLIGLQVAVSVVLVTIAALCVGQVRTHGGIDTGMDLDRLALIEVDFAKQGYEEGRVRAIVDQAVQQMARRPGIDSISVSSGLPVGIHTPGTTLTGPAGAAEAELVAASPEILGTLGIATIRGRGLDARDLSTTPQIVVLSAKAATSVFGSADPLGQQVRVERLATANEAKPSESILTVVGITEDTDTELIGQRPHGSAYVPWTQWYEARVVFTARSAGDPALLVEPMRRVLRDIDPDIGVAQAVTGSTLLAQEVLLFQVIGSIAIVLGTMALALALAGLYGVLSFVVSGRTREIGIRVALGAEASAIRRQVIREGLRPVVFGLVIGLGAGAVARMAVQPMFEEMLPALDVTMLLLVPVLFIVAGIAASYLPAWRASRVDANVALRTP